MLQSLVSSLRHPVFAKTLLVLSSLILMRVLSGSWSTPVFLLACCISTYSYLFLVAQRAWGKSFWVLWLPQLLMISFFILLQQRGHIAVLSASNAAQPTTALWLMGYSFYFLQLIGIMNAVLQGEEKLPHPLDYLLALCYFPKFISGPIESPSFLRRVRDYRFRFNKGVLDEALPLILVGATFKFVLALHLSRLVDLGESTSPLRILSSTLAFEFQVYFDFCGYSLLAFGIARILGLPIIYNFRQPFGSRNLPEFWRRWHIGLGRWFHEQVYNRLRTRYAARWWRRAFLPFLVFMLSAMWHGTTINYLIWGFFHACSFIFFVGFLSNLSLPAWCARVHLYLTLLVGRFLFMDPETGRLFAKMKTMFSGRAWLSDLKQRQSILDDLMMKLGPEGLVIVCAATGFILWEVWGEDEAVEGHPYAFLNGNVAFALAFAMFLLFFPVSSKLGFVYGR